MYRASQSQSQKYTSGDETTFGAHMLFVRKGVSQSDRFQEYLAQSPAPVQRMFTVIDTADIREKPREVRGVPTIVSPVETAFQDVPPGIRASPTILTATLAIFEGARACSAFVDQETKMYVMRNPEYLSYDKMEDTLNIEAGQQLVMTGPGGERRRLTEDEIRARMTTLNESNKRRGERQ
jgi:hypothetical protein